MTAAELYREASRRGLRLEPRGDKLAVFPANNCPPEFAEILRQNKGEIISWLKSVADRLAPDTAPWLHIARQVLAGEFNGADNSTVQSLMIGLRSIQHPLCQRAVAQLKINQ